MDRLIRFGLLYDFYAELLTPKQRSVVQRYCHENLSLAEIAEEEGSSRAAVYDLLQRAEELLEQYESKLHLFERFHCRQKALQEAGRILQGMRDSARAAGPFDLDRECDRLERILESIQED